MFNLSIPTQPALRRVGSSQFRLGLAASPRQNAFRLTEKAIEPPDPFDFEAKERALTIDETTGCLVRQSAPHHISAADALHRQYAYASYMQLAARIAIVG